MRALMMIVSSFSFQVSSWQRDFPGHTKHDHRKDTKKFVQLLSAWCFSWLLLRWQKSHLRSKAAVPVPRKFDRFLQRRLEAAASHNDEFSSSIFRGTRCVLSANL